MKTFATLIFSVLLFSGLNTSAQGSPDTTDTPGVTFTELPKVVQIAAVYNDDQEKSDASKERKPIVVYPDNIIQFKVTRPLAFLNARPSDQSKVVLYVNGVEMSGITSDWCSNISREQINAGLVPQMPDTADIFVKMIRSDSTREAWRFFYKNTNHFWDNYASLNVSIGWQGMSALTKKAKPGTVSIVYYHQAEFYIWLFLFVLITLFFVRLALTTDVLRDGANGAHSLSLTQLFFWLTLTIGGFIYTVVLTDVATSFNTSILLLIGISSGTTGLAYAIDSNFAQTNKKAPKKKPRNFIIDILTDNSGYSVQRIQSFVWNLVLGTYFILYTIDNKSMPEFSSTLLFLAGVSSASYLGAKIPENTNALTAVGAAGGKRNQKKSDSNGPDNSET